MQRAATQSEILGIAVASPEGFVGHQEIGIRLKCLQSLRLPSYMLKWTHHAYFSADMVWFFRRLRSDDTWRKVAVCCMPAVIPAVDLLWRKFLNQTPPQSAADILDYEVYGDASSNEGLLGRRTRVLLALQVQPADMVLCAQARIGWRFLAVAHRVIVAKVLGCDNVCSIACWRNCR
jgi:hypothetical protein